MPSYCTPEWMSDLPDAPPNTMAKLWEDFRKIVEELRK